MSYVRKPVVTKPPQPQGHIVRISNYPLGGYLNCARCKKGQTERTMEDLSNSKLVTAQLHVPPVNVIEQFTVLREGGRRSEMQRANGDALFGFRRADRPAPLACVNKLIWRYECAAQNAPCSQLAPVPLDHTVFLAIHSPTHPRRRASPTRTGAAGRSPWSAGSRPRVQRQGERSSRHGHDASCQGRDGDRAEGRQAAALRRRRPRHALPQAQGVRDGRVRPAGRQGRRRRRQGQLWRKGRWWRRSYAPSLSRAFSRSRARSRSRAHPQQLQPRST